MTKEKALYQVKLVLDNLEEEDYNKLRKEDLEYIYKNMEYDENIKINPNVPFEQLNLDEKSYKLLEVLISNAEISSSNVNKEKMSTNLEYNKLLEKFNLAVNKNKEMEKIILDYNKLLESKDEELKNIKEDNKNLYCSIQKCPFLIRKIFFKDFESKLLK